MSLEETGYKDEKWAQLPQCRYKCRLFWTK